MWCKPLAGLEAVSSTARAIIPSHVGVIAMSTGCWLVHLCGRASSRMLARAAANQLGATDANAWR
eukprot:4841238-Pyramimonas_sp.AAC.1